MSYTKIQPEEVSFETTENMMIKKHIRYASLRSIFLTKEDILKGKLEFGSYCYSLYLSEDLYNTVFTVNNNINRKFDRVKVIASFQLHTNDSTIVLCKILEPKNRRNLKFLEATAKIEYKKELNKLFLEEMNCTEEEFRKEYLGEFK